MFDSQPSSSAKKRSAIASFMFASRWLQLPLYLGLILAQCVYVFHFWVELKDLVRAALGNDVALQHIFQAVAVPGAPLPDKLSSIHLLKTFSNAQSYDAQTIIAQTCIHAVFLLSAMAIAYTDRIMTNTQSESKHH